MLYKYVHYQDTEFILILSQLLIDKIHHIIIYQNKM